MLKKIFWTVLALSLISGGVYAWFYFSNKQKVAVTPAAGNGLPAGASATTSMPSSSVADTFPKGDTISIGTAQGGVEVKNFYNSLVDTEEGLAIIENNDNDEIAYDRTAGIFYIYLKTAAASQDQAEGAFLKILGVGQQEACKLDASVFQPNQAGGKSLSFCPGR